jgi:hypothetical protein
MRSGIHKYAYWGQEFTGGKGKDVELADFNLCGEVIPQLEGYEVFQVLKGAQSPRLGKDESETVTTSRPE